MASDTRKNALGALGIRETDQDSYASLKRFLAIDGKHTVEDIDYLTNGKVPICQWIKLDLKQMEVKRKERKALTTLPEAASTPAEVPTSSVAAQTQTKTGKQVKAIIKDGKATPARGANETPRGRQALEHRKAITVSKGKVVNIYLEPAFEVAADMVAKLAGGNKSDWFKQVINSNTVMNPTAALRIDIVSRLTELLEATK